jgi:hypothetical protein
MPTTSVMSLLGLLWSEWLLQKLRRKTRDIQALEICNPSRRWPRLWLLVEARLSWELLSLEAMIKR